MRKLPTIFFFFFDDGLSQGATFIRLWLKEGQFELHGISSDGKSCVFTKTIPVEGVEFDCKGAYETADQAVVWCTRAIARHPNDVRQMGLVGEMHLLRPGSFAARLAATAPEGLTEEGLEISQSGEVYCHSTYIATSGRDQLRLDDSFTAQELRWLADYLDNRPAE